MQGTVYINVTTGAAEFVPDLLDRDNGAAYGYYNNSINETGWAVLEIKTTLDDSVDNKQKMYAAGFLEGVLTARYIDRAPYLLTILGRIAYEQCIDAASLNQSRCQRSVDSGGRKEPCIGWGPDPPPEEGVILGAYCKEYPAWSQSYSAGGSGDAAFRLQYSSNLFVLLRPRLRNHYSWQLDNL